MKKIYYSDSEMLTRFLDGDLSNEEEFYIQNKISSDNHLQMQVDDMLSIRESISKDTEAFCPPADLKHAIIDKIGFNKPKSISNHSNYIWLLAALILMIPIYFIVAYYVADNKTGLTPVAIESLTSESDNSSILDSENVTADRVSTSENKVNNRFAGVYEASDDIAADNDYFATTDSDSDINDNNYLIDISNYKNYNYNQLLEMHKTNYSTIGLDITDKRYNRKSKHKYVNVRGQYDVYNSFSVANNTFTNSFIASFLVSSDILDGLYLGVEFGKESYYQEFMRSAESSDQNGDIMWLGIGASYHFRSLEFLTLTPYVEIVAGGSDVGPLGRLFGGISKTYSSGVGFNLGIDGSLLFYKYQDKFYTSKKIGISAGVIYSF